MSKEHKTPWRHRGNALFDIDSQWIGYMETEQLAARVVEAENALEKEVAERETAQ